jgi:hypothetical protein
MYIKNSTARIICNPMEYVGEIVGQQVADKRDRIPVWEMATV